MPELATPDIDELTPDEKKEVLEKLKALPEWGAFPDDRKVGLARKAAEQARIRKAATRLIAEIPVEQPKKPLLARVFPHGATLFKPARPPVATPVAKKAMSDAEWQRAQRAWEKGPPKPIPERMGEVVAGAWVKLIGNVLSAAERPTLLGKGPSPTQAVEAVTMPTMTIRRLLFPTTEPDRKRLVELSDEIDRTVKEAGWEPENFQENIAAALPYMVAVVATRGAALKHGAPPIIANLVSTFIPVANRRAEVYREQIQGGADEQTAQLRADAMGAVEGGLQMLIMSGGMHLAGSSRKVLSQRAMQYLSQIEAGQAPHLTATQIAAQYGLSGLSLALAGQTREVAEWAIEGKDIPPGLLGRRVADFLTGVLFRGLFHAAGQTQERQLQNMRIWSDSTGTYAYDTTTRELLGFDQKTGVWAVVSRNKPMPASSGRLIGEPGAAKPETPPAPAQAAVADLLTPQGAAAWAKANPAAAAALAVRPNPSRMDIQRILIPPTRWNQAERTQFAALVKEAVDAGTIRGDQAVDVGAGPQPAGKPAGGRGDVQQAPQAGQRPYGAELRTAGQAAQPEEAVAAEVRPVEGAPPNWKRWARSPLEAAILPEELTQFQRDVYVSGILKADQEVRQQGGAIKGYASYGSYIRKTKAGIDPKDIDVFLLVDDVAPLQGKTGTYEGDLDIFVTDGKKILTTVATNRTGGYRFEAVKVALPTRFFDKNGLPVGGPAAEAPLAEVRAVEGGGAPAAGPPQPIRIEVVRFDGKKYTAFYDTQTRKIYVGEHGKVGPRVAPHEVGHALESKVPDAIWDQFEDEAEAAWGEEGLPRPESEMFADLVRKALTRRSSERFPKTVAALGDWIGKQGISYELHREAPEEKPKAKAAEVRPVEAGAAPAKPELKIEGFTPDADASVGKPGQSVYRYQAPPKGEPPKQLEAPGPLKMEMPEVVHMAQTLLGEFPHVAEKLGRGVAASASGIFIPKKGQIGLRADIAIGPVIETGLADPRKADSIIEQLRQRALAEHPELTEQDIVVRKKREGEKVRITLYRKDPEHQAQVLAHELGHAVDWLPDKTLRRGNILGRIASLHKFIGDWLGESPKGAKPLTAEEREAMRAQAEEWGKIDAEMEVTIDEEIRKIIPVTSADVLAIFNDASQSIKATNPGLYQYVAGLSSGQKKQLVLSAFKGMLPDEVQQFAKTILEGMRTRTEKVKITATKSRDEIRQKFSDLMLEEARKRRLLSKEQVEDELKGLSQWWKPFDEAASPGYTQYRHSPHELYADALSVLMNNPGELRRRAPEFYRGFFGWMEKKPEVQAAYDAIQDEIRSGTAAGARETRLRQGFRKADAAMAASAGRTWTWRDMRVVLGEWVVDRFWANKAGMAGRAKAGKLAPGKNPEYAVEHAVYGGAQTELFHADIEREPVRTVKEAGLTWEDFGVYAFARRVLGERTEMLNPYGIRPKEAQEMLDGMRGRMGDQAMEALEKAHTQFEKAWQDDILKPVLKEHMWSPALEEYARNNAVYATITPLEVIENEYGKTTAGHLIPAGVRRQIGMLGEIGNPATMTILKAYALTRAADWNRAKRLAVDTERVINPEGVEPAELLKGTADGKPAFREPDDPDKGLIVYSVDGKPQGFYIDRWKANEFQGEDPRAVRVVYAIFNAFGAPFRAIFTTLRPGFQAFNIQRDPKRAIRTIPGARKVNIFSERWFGRYMLKSFGPAFRSAYGNIDPVVREMLEAHALIPSDRPMGMGGEDRDLAKFVMGLQDNPAAWHEDVTRPFLYLYEHAVRLGAGFERTTKIAGWEYYKEHFPDMPIEERAHRARTEVGSPPFLTKGQAAPIIGNILLFANPATQGYRYDYRKARREPGDAAWKAAKNVILPKAIRYAIYGGGLAWLMRSAGVEDDDPALLWVENQGRLMRNISEHDLSNYNCTALGETPSGKTVYLRSPQDEGDRLIGGIAWKIMTREGGGEVLRDVGEYGAGQLPGMNPAIKIAGAAWDYFTGKNPVDEFRNRPVVPENLFDAYDMRTHAAFAKWISNQAGGGVIYQFPSDDVGQIKTHLEEVLGMPGFGDTLGRFIKVSDRGAAEDLRKAAGKERQQRARQIEDVKGVIIKQVKGEKLTPDELQLLADDEQYVKRTGEKMEARYFNETYMNALLGAGTVREREAMIDRILEREEGNKEFNIVPLIEKDIIRHADALVKTGPLNSDEKVKARLWLAKVGMAERDAKAMRRANLRQESIERRRKR